MFIFVPFLAQKCTPVLENQGMTLNCIHIFVVTGSFLYWCVRRPASQRFFIRGCIYWILIISYLATFLGTNSLSVLMCRKAVNQSFWKVEFFSTFILNWQHCSVALHFCRYCTAKCKGSSWSASILKMIVHMSQQCQQQHVSSADDRA